MRFILTMLLLAAFAVAGFDRLSKCVRAVKQ